MNIDTTREETLDISYRNEDFETFVQELVSRAEHSEHHLSLFLGLYHPNKEKALAKIHQATGLSIQRLDFNDFVSKSEIETARNLDAVFNRYKSSGSLLYFQNGDKLCGAYTGFSHSRVKYASPQERHFLKLVQDFRGLVIVDISEYSAADKTIRRAAQSIVRFDLPDSKIQRFMWHLKNYTLHGFELKTKRPDSYGEVPGNF